MTTTAPDPSEPANQVDPVNTGEHQAQEPNRQQLPPTPDGQDTQPA
jgi:hypothetical protein